MLYYTYKEQQQQSREEKQQFQKHSCTLNRMQKVNVYFFMAQMNFVDHVFQHSKHTTDFAYQWISDWVEQQLE